MSIKNPCAADIAHLREGDEVDVSFDQLGVRVQGTLAETFGNLTIGGWVVRHRQGEAGPILSALHSPLPPAPEPPPVGQRRRSPEGAR